jgi:hypothetical protein
MVYDTLYDSVSVYSYSIPSLPLMNLNLRTTDPHDRSMELFFDNTSSNEVPKKGIYYKGNRNDRLNSIQAGTTTNDQLSSQTLPSTQLEGASIVLESKERVSKAATARFFALQQDQVTLQQKHNGVRLNIKAAALTIF